MTCCNKPMTLEDGVYVCKKCGASFDAGAAPAPVVSGGGLR